MNDLSSKDLHDLPLHCDNRFKKHTPTTTKNDILKWRIRIRLGKNIGVAIGFVL